MNASAPGQSRKGGSALQGHRGGEPELPAKLDRGSALLADALGKESQLVRRLDSLRERLRHNRLQLAVLGQFKRGKSTFINALLGAPLLPVAVVPLTAVPIFISWSAEPLVRVRFKDNLTEELAGGAPDSIREFLFRFVAEEANPENRLGVDRVDLFYPASILADNTVLIDTPGVGSTFRHNTESALHVLPECDAVLFVVSPDPPITEAELDYLRQLKSKVVKILFVLNKADYVRFDERARLTDFLRDVLIRNGLWQPGSMIFNVSARDGLDAKQRGNRDELESSGFAEIENHLREYLAAGKIRTLTQAVASKAESILSEASTEVDLQGKTIAIPLDELLSKLQLFEHTLKSIEDQRHIVQDLLAGEQRRLVVELKSRTDRLHDNVCTKLSKVIDRKLERTEAPLWAEGAQRHLATAIESAFDSAREKLVSAFSADANAAFAAHKRRLDNLINEVRKAAASIFEIQFYGTSEDDVFQLTNDPYWVTQHVQESLIPDPSGLIDRLLPRTVRRARLRERVIKTTNELVLRNTSSLHWALLQSINDTFRRATSEFEERLNAAIEGIKKVIEATLERRRTRAFEVEPEVRRLDQLRAALFACRDEIITARRAEESSTPRATETVCAAHPSPKPIG